MMKCKFFVKHNIKYSENCKNKLNKILLIAIQAIFNSEKYHNEIQWGMKMSTTFFLRIL